MPEKHTLQMTYIGGPTTLIEFGGLRLLTDPGFDPAGSEYTNGPVTLAKAMGPAVAPSSLDNIDAVLLSHDHHFDNLDRSGREFLALAARVLTTQEGAQRLGGNAVGLAHWEAAELMASDGGVLQVTATPARHGPEGGDRGPVIGFILRFLDTLDHAVYVSGDTVWYEGVEEVIRRFQVKTAVLFMGAARVSVLPPHLTFTAEEGVKVARALPDARIVPLHYEGWKHFSESREAIARSFAKAGMSDRLVWLEAGRATGL